MPEHPILSGLDPEQRAAAQAVRGPVCILAGAGTGKTRAITHRIAYAVATESVRPDHVLAVTFTARAAGELRSRLRALGTDGVQARTFHAAALRMLSYFWPRLVGGEMPRIVESKLGLVAEAASRGGARRGGTELRDLAAEIEWAKARMIAPDAYAAAAAAAHREPPLPPAETAAIYAGYEKAKRRAGSIDFDDLLLLTAAGIEEHDDVADEVRARYRSFVVDEYQDVNPLQQRLLDAWLGGRDDLCVVGDPNQTIYSFTGATPDFLLDFPRRYDDATVVRLVRDYRSTPQVVALANRITAVAVPGSRVINAPDLVAQRAAGPAPQFREYADEPAEAADVARRIRILVDGGVPAAQIAVLYRINAQSEAYEQALADAGIPYVVRGGTRFFERPEVRAARAALRTAAGALDVPESADESADEVALTETVRAVLLEAGWAVNPPPGGGAARDKWEALAALVTLADDLATADPEVSLADYLAELDDRAAHQHAPTVDGVTLASLHAAKGLEWDAVFLVGVVDGTLPIQHAVTPEQIAEERRLLYVGVTRARETLVVTWAQARNVGGRKTRRPSRFLTDVPEVAAMRAATADRSASGGRDRFAAKTASCRVCGKPVFAAAERKLRRCLTCPSSMDEVLFERLREWRLGRASEQKQPAFCVFTDATLTAIAEARPTSVAELVLIPGVGASKLAKYGDDVLAITTA
jgi:DNA helicase II / ATP-dependent DNA helicase PcrA